MLDVTLFNDAEVSYQVLRLFTGTATKFALDNIIL